ncbi:MAG: 1-(5-phosphoribosyl)-5-[(5-phosphoribosylamino)methylideneamino]imidazole-4-carboxamide isomerase [Oscillospiraceae bacterium]|nr:1-(5-phosphoribosyl)-5-[(5-phosphoribosylamino)methylideneamino]imidazole-4-carboxamide isomerase [Oscillospiraceae bacterium]
MLILPAIDLCGGKAVRLYQGDYAQMTVYSNDPPAVAQDFAAAGAAWVHLVDLEGAKRGDTPNLETVQRIVAAVPQLRVELGGGIRQMETAARYLDDGVSRVVLGTAAVTDPAFAADAVSAFGADRVAVGADVRDGYVAIHGWTEQSGLDALGFCQQMQRAGVRTVICTDISRDGAMRGANHALYQTLSAQLDMDIIASGGVSSIEDVRALRALGLSGAIIGKAYYTGAISLREAIEVAK